MKAATPPLVANAQETAFYGVTKMKMYVASFLDDPLWWLEELAVSALLTSAPCAARVLALDNCTMLE